MLPPGETFKPSAEDDLELIIDLKEQHLGPLNFHIPTKLSLAETVFSTSRKQNFQMCNAQQQQQPQDKTAKTTIRVKCWHLVALLYQLLGLLSPVDLVSALGYIQGIIHGSFSRSLKGSWRAKVASSCLVVESCVKSRLGGGELLWVMVSICYPLQEHLSTLHSSISVNNSEENFMEHFLLLLVWTWGRQPWHEGAACCFTGEREKEIVGVGVDIVQKWQGLWIVWFLQRFHTPIC